MSNPFFEDIHDAMESVMLLHNSGCAKLEKLFHLKRKNLTVDDVSSVVIDVATEIASYNSLFRVHPTKLDLTKVLTFAAASLSKSDPDFTGLPLFFSYIDFLDGIYSDTGMTIRDFGESIIYAENLDMMLKKGQWMAPFCYFRAIDLAFDRCAIPRIEALQRELETLRS